MPVRVLWLTKGLGPGGAERLLVELSGVVDRDRAEVSAAYVLPWKDHLAGALEANGVRTTCLSRRRRDPAWPLALRRLLLVGEIDVVHAHSPVPAVAARLVRWTLPAQRRPAIVTTEHNTWRSHHPLTRWANRLTGRSDAATYAVTAEAAASVRGAAATRTEVLTHGIDVDAAAARPPGTVERMRAELGLGPDELVIGIVANFRPQKDHDTLLAAARRLADDGVAFRLVIVGQGPLHDEIASSIERLELTDYVVLAGYRDDALDVIAALDVFTLSSAWEGLPVAIMEALALGRPIVATAVGGVAEALDDTAAVLVPPRDPDALADAWRTLLSDPHRRRSLSAGARHLAERFDIRHAAATLLTTYEAAASASEGSVRGRPSSRPRMTSEGDTRARRADPAIEIRPTIAGDRDAIIDLLGASLGWQDDERARSLFTWKHETNPFGPSYAWVAEHDGRIVAVRLFMRWRFRRGAGTVEAVRAVDTATHPDYQGMGLFRALTMEGIERCRADGIGFVFNTPNDQSRPGYLTMGWRDVGRVATSVRPTGVGQLRVVLTSRVPAERWSEPMAVGRPVAEWLAGDGASHFPDPVIDAADRTLRTDIDNVFRTWRYGIGDLHYRVVETDDRHAAAIVRLRRRGDSRELVVVERLGDLDAADQLAARTAASVGASHAVRLGPPNVRRGFLPLPGGGPVLTWRALADQGPPPLPNWDLAMRDIELF